MAPRPIPLWVRVLVVFGIIEVLLMQAGVVAGWSDLLQQCWHLSRRVVEPWVKAAMLALPLGTVALLVLGLRRPRAVSRWPRALVLLTLAQGISLFFALPLAMNIHPRLAWSLSPLTRVLLSTLLLGLAVVAVLGALLRERIPTRTCRTLTVLLFTHALLFGLCLPLLARISALTPDPRAYGGPLLEGTLAGLGLPALLLAAWAALRADRSPPRWLRGLALLALLALLVTGTAVFLVDSRTSVFVVSKTWDAYGAFSWVLVLELCLATAAIGLWAVLDAVGRRRTLAELASARRGIIRADGDGVVAWFRYVDWTRGTVGEVARFTLETRGGALEVPAGTLLCGALPAEAWQLRVGERVPVLRAGEQVVVAGYLEPREGGAYRDSSLPLPGPRGLVVAPAQRAREEWAARLFWPCALSFFVTAATLSPPLVNALMQLLR